MALGDPVFVSTTNYLAVQGTAFFTATAETGVSIEGLNRDTSSKKKEVFNMAGGYTAAEVYFDFVANLSVNAIVNGVTGLAVAQPSVVYSFANDLSIGTNKNGVSAGGYYVQTVGISHQAEDLRMITVSAQQRQNIA